MATRLENALLMEIDPKQPIGIIRGASAVAAARAPDRRWSNTAPMRATLFENSYPLAWGEEKVKPDAFLHGLVRLSEDMRRTSVLVTCFDSRSNTPQQVCEIEVQTDRAVLAEAGQSYVIPRGLLKARAGEVGKDGKDQHGNSLDDLLNTDAVESARGRDHGRESVVANEYLDFEVRYDNMSVPLISDPTEEGGRLRVAAPRAGRSVMFALKNKIADDIGVVVYVNGKSTLEYMTDPADRCRRWILPAGGETFGIRGYVDDNDMLAPFKIVGPSDAVKNELASGLGLIQVAVFLKGPAPIPDDRPVSRKLSLLSPSPYYQKKLGIKGKPQTAAEARALAYRSAGLKVPTQVRGPSDGMEGFVVPDPDLRERLTLKQREFPNPVWVATPLVIRYSDPVGN
jgi:hypothetical protein